MTCKSQEYSYFPPEESRFPGIVKPRFAALQDIINIYKNLAKLWIQLYPPCTSNYNTGK
jgi:hypothetical protein